jgi:hypothetical protein
MITRAKSILSSTLSGKAIIKKTLKQYLCTDWGKLRGMYYYFANDICQFNNSVTRHFRIFDNELEHDASCFRILFVPSFILNFHLTFDLTT